MGIPRVERRCKVVGVSVGPEYGPNFPPAQKVYYEGPVADALRYYQYLREKEPAGRPQALAVVDGMGQLMYACS